MAALMMEISFHKALDLQPIEAILGPGMAVAEADAMAAFLVNVQIKRNARLTQRQGKIQAVFHFYDRIFVSVPDKTGRSLGRDLFFVGQLFDQNG